MCHHNNKPFRVQHPVGVFDMTPELSVKCAVSMFGFALVLLVVASVL